MELDEMIQQFINEENIETPENIGTYNYDDILGITFKLSTVRIIMNMTVSMMSGGIRQTMKNI